ncbi:MAG TPA: ATP-binding cassette domain-containing protein, partial [Steroidobacteraceae bacterium]|nr:ATP-binding cassette domain-containing protein [Steroidobacteraceae bacterium]
MGERGAAGGELYVRLSQVAPIPLDVELTCAPGELVALFGPSGSGKTTVVRAIAGLYAPAHALVRCGDATWSDSERGLRLPPQRRAVGVVFQDYALFPHMTVRAQLLAAMDHVPREARAARLTQLIALARLDGFADRRPAALSGGQQQRAAIARA